MPIPAPRLNPSRLVGGKDRSINCGWSFSLMAGLLMTTPPISRLLRLWGPQVPQVWPGLQARQAWLASVVQQGFKGAQALLVQRAFKGQPGHLVLQVPQGPRVQLASVQQEQRAFRVLPALMGHQGRLGRLVQRAFKGQPV